MQPNSVKKRKWPDDTQKWKQLKSANVDKNAKIASEAAVAVARAVVVVPQPVTVQPDPSNSQQIKEVVFLISMRYMMLGTVSTISRR